MKFDKNKAVEAAIRQLERQFGKGTIMRLGEESRFTNIPVIASGSLGLDVATGIGGIPKGRITEIFGPESSGKTTLALHIIAEAQKQGGVAAFIDAEHALDVHYAERLGVKVKDLWVSQPDTGEQALEIAEVLARSGGIDIIVIDSVAALVPRAEIEGDMGDMQVGLQARLMSQAMRKLTAAIAKTQTAVIFINQIRSKIGGMGYGPQETTPGGNALKFYASLRLDIRRIATIKREGEAIGNRIRVRVVKNKMAPPFKEAEFDIYYGKGISRFTEILDLGVKMNIIEKSGAWYSFEGERLGQGRENVRKFLEETPQIAQKIEKMVRELAGLKIPEEIKEKQKNHA